MEFKLRVSAYNSKPDREPHPLMITTETNPKPKLILNPHQPTSKLSYPSSDSNTKPANSKKIKYLITIMKL